METNGPTGETTKHMLVPYSMYPATPELKEVLNCRDTPLTLACRKNDVSAVNTLLSLGADPEFCCNYSPSEDCDDPSASNSPLYIAAIHKHVHVVNALMSERGVSRKHAAEVAFKLVNEGHFEPAHILYEAGVIPCQQTFISAVRFGAVGLAKCLIRTQPVPKNIIFHAAVAGSPEMLNLFDLHVKNDFGQSPLHIAAYWDNADGVKFLLSKGLSPYERDQDGRIPLNGAGPGATKILVRTQVAWEVELVCSFNYSFSPPNSVRGGGSIRPTQRIQNWVKPLEIQRVTPQFFSFSGILLLNLTV